MQRVKKKDSAGNTHKVLINIAQPPVTTTIIPKKKSQNAKIGGGSLKMYTDNSEDEEQVQGKAGSKTR